MSYILVSEDKLKSEEKIAEICNEYKIQKIDITRITKKEASSSLGIKDMKEMMQKIYLKPLKSSSKAIIIEESDLLTPEAQNALLKVLEEPPANTIIVLLASSKEIFLPTILSRCTIIEISNELKFSEDDLKQSAELFSKLITLTTPLALELAEKISKDKEEAPRIIKQLIFVGRQNLLNSINTKNTDQALIAHVLKSLTTTHNKLTTTNINTRLELEHLFLSLVND